MTAEEKAYEMGYETAQQSCAEMMIRRERLLARWLEWARMHGHLGHAEGLVEDTRQVLPPQFFPNVEEWRGSDRDQPKGK